MKAADREQGPDEAHSREALTERVMTLGDAGGFERRHEPLMEWAETELGLERGHAERVYSLAEEEDLEPALALEVVRSGIGVRELEPPGDAAEDDAMQQVPPGWAVEDTVELDDVVMERHLRASFRRLRSHLDASDSPVAAVRRYLADPDVGRVRLR